MSGSVRLRLLIPYGAIDASVNYNVPIVKSLRPYVKFGVFNLLNNQKVIAVNTTVLPDRNGPIDALGLPTTYIKAPSFGHATRIEPFRFPTRV